MTDNKKPSPAIDWIKPSVSARIAIVLSIFLVVAGYLASASYIDVNELSLTRAGALIVIVGLLFESFPLLRIKYGNQVPHWTRRDAPTNARWRVLIIVVGTVIWAFGDGFV